MSWRRSAVIIGLVIAVSVAALLAWGAYLDHRAKVRFEWQIEFAALPADDGALQEWLLAQPDVSAATVRRDGRAVTVVCEVHLLRRGAVVPDVRAKMEELGYRGLERIRLRVGA
jgi:hypothetical protein